MKTKQERLNLYKEVKKIYVSNKLTEDGKQQRLLYYILADLVQKYIGTYYDRDELLYILPEIRENKPKIIMNDKVWWKRNPNNRQREHFLNRIILKMERESDYKFWEHGVNPITGFQEPAYEESTKPLMQTYYIDK